MRILSVTCLYPTPADTSAGLFVRNRLQSLGQRVAVRVLAPVALWNYAQGRHAGRFCSSVMDGSLRVHFLRWVYPPFGGVLNSFFLAAQLLGPTRRLRRNFPYDLIDAHFGYPEGIASALVAAIWRVPFIVTLRGGELLHIRYPMRRWAIEWALRRATAVIAVSEELRQLAVRLGVPAARTFAIPNGVDPGLFFQRDRVACRQKYGVPNGSKLVLAAGHLIPLKGHQHVIKALGSLVNAGSDTHLWIAGAPGHAGMTHSTVLKTLVAELNLDARVRFLGQVTPEVLAELMSAADVFCLASSREGWPNVVHEALACGTPVVATSVGGVPDLIPSDCYGAVVRDANPATLAPALAAALAKTWDRHAIEAWAHSRTWARVAEEVLVAIQCVRAVPQ